MKKVKSKKIRFSKTIALIVVLLISFLSANYVQKSTKNTSLLVSALTPHSSISITDDSGFSGFPGIGTFEDPYLIDDYNITTTDSSGISITGTTKYFQISNCYVDALDYGIYIHNIADSTATITNNTCEYNNDDGIYFSSSNNNTVSGNICENNNWYGIYLYSSNNNTVSGNNCSNNNKDGIRLYSSSYNTVSGNICENDHYGIYISYSNNNTLSGNNCSNNNIAGGAGIYLYSSSYNTISGNNCSNNIAYGIRLSSSSNNILSGNNCPNNDYYGIGFVFSNNNTVSENNCTNNNYDGINLFSSSYNTISGNNCPNNNDGIDLDHSNYNILSGNNCSNNNEGIRIFYSSYNTVSRNNCSNNNNDGIYIYSSSNNTVSENNCIKILRGIYLYKSNCTIINENFLQDNSGYGVWISSLSFNNPIYENTFDNNNLGGTSQGFDDGVENKWYDTISLQGNYWSDWNGSVNYSIDGSSNSFDSYPSEYPSTLPIIENVTHSPSTPTNFDVITISTTVNDASGIDSVTLHYRIDGGSWTTISMTLSTGSTYQITIGPFTTDSTVEYYITATDNDPKHNESTEDNNGLFYQFTVIQGDIVPPTITDVSHEPSAPTDLETITISATVSDASGIDSVTLHYRINGSSWSTTSMTLSTGSIYQATIGSFTNSSIIDYFITAIDSATNHNEATNDNNGLYYSFTVSSSVVIPEFQNLSMVFASFISLLFLFFVLVIQKRRKE